MVLKTLRKTRIIFWIHKEVSNFQQSIFNDFMVMLCNYDLIYSKLNLLSKHFIGYITIGSFNGRENQYILRHQDSAVLAAGHR